MKNWIPLIFLLLCAEGWAAPPPSSEGHQPLVAPQGARAPKQTDLPGGKDLLSWQLLAQAEPILPKKGKPGKGNGRIEILLPEGWEMPKPKFTDEIKALDGKEVKIAGFMFPMEAAGDKQKKFLLAHMPPSCAFCLPGGPESLIVVEAKRPILFTLEPIIIKGQFFTLSNDEHGMFYKMTNAIQEK